MKCLREKVSGLSAAVYIAVVLFSMSTWMDVVGVWIEMPLFVTTLPEGWGLPSYLVIIIQLANIGPAIYAIVEKFRQGNRLNSDHKTMKRLDTEVVLTLAIITVSAVNAFLLSFLWQKTSVIGGSRHSVVMLAQMVPTALTSCMTSLVFLPYMARFPSSYISAFYVGQGFSGLIPGLIGLVQGAGSPPSCSKNITMLLNGTSQNVTDEVTFVGLMTTTATAIVQQQMPLFSIQIFFICLTALFLVSLAAFCCLNFTKCGRSVMITTDASSNEGDNTVDISANEIIHETPITDADSPNHIVNLTSSLVYVNDETIASSEAQNEQSLNCHELLRKTDTDASVSCQQVQIVDSSVSMENRVFIWLLIVIGVVNALSNGLLPATESYTCLPYGYLVYTLAVRLSSVAASLAALSSMFLPRASVKVVSFLTLVGLAIAMFHLVLALQSPNPVLRDHVLGDIIVVSKSMPLIVELCRTSVDTKHYNVPSLISRLAARVGSSAS